MPERDCHVVIAQANQMTGLLVRPESVAGQGGLSSKTLSTGRVEPGPFWPVLASTGRSLTLAATRTLDSAAVKLRNPGIGIRVRLRRNMPV